MTNPNPQECEAMKAAFQGFWDGSLFGDQEQPARGMAEAMFRRGFEAGLEALGLKEEVLLSTKRSSGKDENTHRDPGH